MQKALVIGGGLFGCTIAAELATLPSWEVDLVEVDRDVMLKASRANHNRVHLGYHYLRSIQTAEQSIEGMLSFFFHYGQSVVTQFPNYYAIAAEGSKTTAEEFVAFCHKVSIGYDEEYPAPHIIDPDTLEACFKVPEPVFDYQALKDIVTGKLDDSGVRVQLGTRCEALEKKESGFRAVLNGKVHEYDVVVNASYAALNEINSMLDLPLRRLKFEDVVVPFFLYPSASIGLTIMDGPFCSVMPKGMNKNEFLLYHVQHSVLRKELAYQNPLEARELQQEQLDQLYEESAYFYPFLRDVRPFGYWRTTRVVHENSDDARLSELFTYEGVDNYFTVLSGKVTTCVQVALDIKHRIQGKANDKRFKI